MTIAVGVGVRAAVFTEMVGARVWSAVVGTGITAIAGAGITVAGVGAGVDYPGSTAMVRADSWGESRSI